MLYTIQMKKTTKIASQKTDQRKIGSFIKRLREEEGFTQADFAKALGTTQSTIARMETGNQNMTLENLENIGRVLERNIISLSETTDLRITGGRKLKGRIKTNTSKNGAINMLCATLVNTGKTTLYDVPKVQEVFRYIELLESIGVTIIWKNENTLEVTVPKKLLLEKLDRNVANRIRSFTFLGGLVHHSSHFSFPHSGGCKMGERTISSHKFGLEKFGITIVTKENEYIVSHKKLQAREVVMYESSDTGAITLLIAAARIPGKTVIKFAPPNYQVQDVCFLLQNMGIQIDGIGTTTLTVHGKETISGNFEGFVSEDPIESMFFIGAGIVTKSTLTIERVPIEFIELEMEKLLQMGLKFKKSTSYLSKNNRTKLVDITITPSKLVAVSDKIHALPFPGIQNDNLPFFVPICLQAEGKTLVHDWTWENRAIYFMELNHLGAGLTLLDPHRVLVDGPKKLKGSQIICPPALRPSASILMAMLGAEGVSTLRNVYSITRGYEDIAERLNKIGAKIEVLKGI
jgi:UDP-N-acetylglucosamine 1-carboxyvinyltransferase